MNVIIMDCSHRDRPHLAGKASEVISDSQGTHVIGVEIPFPVRDYEMSPTSIHNLARDIVQSGGTVFLSHDWVVKVWN